MRRCLLALWVSALAISPAMAAERMCDADTCVTLAWPDRSAELRTPDAVEAAAAHGDLTRAEAEAALELTERRLTLRIRGLELRYLIGKTATSSTDPRALEPIRYQVDAIDQEIAFIDLELAGLLAAYSRRLGPWLAVSQDDEAPALWLIGAPPCDRLDDVAVATNGSGPWMAAVAVSDPMAPIKNPPSDCTPWRIATAHTEDWRGATVVRLRLNGAAWDFPLRD